MVLEFNARFGDPETQPILMRLQTDLIHIIQKTIQKKLHQVSLNWRQGASTCVVLASEGYPGRYPKGREIHGLEDVDHDGGTDLILHFITRDLNLSETSTEATLTGETYGGKVIKGTDAVRIVHGLEKSYDEVIDVLPTIFALYNNYPNPFNPKTQIRYALPEQVKVRMDIYNVTGKKVVTLVDRVMSAGYHSVTWDGRDRYKNVVSCGLYLCRIQAGSYNQVIRMLLLK